MSGLLMAFKGLWQQIFIIQEVAYWPKINLILRMVAARIFYHSR